MRDSRPSFARRLRLGDPLVVLTAVTLVGLLVVLIASCGGSDADPGDENGAPTGLSDTGGSETGAVDVIVTETVGAAAPPPTEIRLPKGKTLGTGSTGKAVVALQRALLALGFDPGAPDGFFGERTRQAAIAFQEKQGLGADGIVGPETVDAINTALRRLEPG